MSEAGGVDLRAGMQSVLRSLDALEAISRLQPVRLSDLARTVGLPKTTVARILRTLNAAGWIADDADQGDPRWSLTPRAFAIGATRGSSVDLRDIARPTIEWLAGATEENIHLSKPDGDSMVLIERVPSSRSVQTVANVGDSAPIFQTASGWAYLSRLPEPEAESLLPENLTATTDLSVVDRGSLLAELAGVRQSGYATNPGRWRSDVASIAAAIINTGGRPIAALSISMPSYRFTPALADQYGLQVKSAAATISGEMSRLMHDGISVAPRVNT